MPDIWYGSLLNAENNLFARQKRLWQTHIWMKLVLKTVSKY